MENEIRLFNESDFNHVLVVWRIAREMSSNGDVIARKHTLVEDIGYLKHEILPKNTVWVAESHGIGITGFMAIQGEFIDCLYIHPDHQGQGIGRALLAHARTLSPQRIWLYTMADNTRARAFYEKYGFKLMALGHNAEGLPDASYEFISTESKP